MRLSGSVNFSNGGFGGMDGILDMEFRFDDATIPPTQLQSRRAFAKSGLISAAVASPHHL